MNGCACFFLRNKDANDGATLYVHFLLIRISAMAAAIPAYDLALDELCVALSYVTMTKVPVYTPPAAPAPAKAEEAPKKAAKVRRESSSFPVARMLVIAHGVAMRYCLCAVLNKWVLQ